MDVERWNNSEEGIDLVFIGKIIHCFPQLDLQILDLGFIIVRGNCIIAIDKISELKETKKRLQVVNFHEIVLSSTQILIPGLIDTHIHAAQYPNSGLGYDKQLLDWLQIYTYHLEKKYKDVEFAKHIYKAVVKKTLSHGTTTACYFATLHVDSTLALVDAAISEGQRAFIGKVNMTEMCPDDFVETIEESLANTEIFLQTFLAKKSELVRPIITPRFALSCTEDLMEKLGGIAKKYDINIQSHISENMDEVHVVQEKFGKKYAFVYDDAGLLTTKTVLAHGVHLDEDEIKLLAKRGTSISHCPASNCCLQSGSCDVRKLLDAGVNVGLGTDISGGPSPSMIEAMRCALQNSIHRSFTMTEYKPLSCYDAFYLATLGGAKALSLENKIGNFKVGKDFDALIVDVDVPNSNIDFLQTCSALELLQKFIYTADDRNVVSVFVSGRRVK